MCFSTLIPKVEAKILIAGSEGPINALWSSVPPEVYFNEPENAISSAYWLILLTDVWPVLREAYSNDDYIRKAVPEDRCRSPFGSAKYDTSHAGFGQSALLNVHQLSWMIYGVLSRGMSKRPQVYAVKRSSVPRF